MCARVVLCVCMRIHLLLLAICWQTTHHHISACNICTSLSPSPCPSPFPSPSPSLSGCLTLIASLAGRLAGRQLLAGRPFI